MNLQKQIAVFFLLFIFLSNIKAQNINEFYFEANTARKLAKEGKIDSAITTYENAFKKVDYVFIRYLERVKELAHLNNDKERVRKYTTQIKKQFEGTNPQLRAIIDSLNVIDQKVRKGKYRRKSMYAIKCIEKKNCKKNSEKYKKSKIALDNWCKTDSLSTHHLLNLFKNYGFIGEELVGIWGSIHVSSMLLHFDQDTNNTVLEPVLEKARNEGKIEPKELAQILDRHLGGKYTIQKYWMWPYVGKEKLQFTKEDIPKIIKLRESIGIYDLGIRQEEQIQGFNKLIHKKLWRLINYYKE